MRRYTVDATLIICVADLKVTLPDDPTTQQDMEDELTDAVIRAIKGRLALLDIKGGRSGSDGIIEHAQCDGVENWVREE